MKPPFGDKPSDEEVKLYTKIFPKLKKDEWTKTGNATQKYNCYAWSLCHNDWGWMQPFSETSNYSVNDFDDFFTFYGFEIRDDSKGNCKPEYKKRKIILYCIDGVPQHSAKEIADNDWWESKLGSGIRIVHRAKQLEGSKYGQICRCYSRDDASANLTLKGEH